VLPAIITTDPQLAIAERICDVTWLLLIYAVPSQPPGKRAAVWRDIKQSGAVYLRDGVVVLPESPRTRSAFDTIASRIIEREGQATVVSSAVLPAQRAAEIVARGQDDRAAELAEFVREAEGFLDYLAAESVHREFSPAERRTLAKDRDRLQAWAAQILDRDHFAALEANPAHDLLDRCDRALDELDTESSYGRAAS
jgi:hypothetical protein